MLSRKYPDSGFAVAKLLLPIVFLVVGLLVFRYLVDSKPEPTIAAPEEKTWSIQTRELISGKRAPQIEVQAKVEAPDRYQAAAPGVGWVDIVRVRVGDSVSKDDTLLSLDPRDFTTAITQAEAELADIEAQLVEGDIRFTQNRAALVGEKQILALTKKSVARNQKLQTQSLSSESDLENAQQAFTRQQLLVNQRELEVKSYDSKQQQLNARKKRVLAQLAQAQRALERSLVIAPFDGIISSVKVAAGAHVNTGAELLTMYSPLQLELRGLIPARYQQELSQALARKQPLLARQKATDTLYTLARIAGEASPGGIDGFFLTKDSSTLNVRPGELITLMLERPAQTGLFSVPASAIYDNERIYLVRDERLFGVSIEIVGQATEAGKTNYLVRSPDIGAREQLVLTRLPNATTGLKVDVIQAVTH